MRKDERGDGGGDGREDGFPCVRVVQRMDGLMKDDHNTPAEMWKQLPPFSGSSTSAVL